MTTPTIQQPPSQPLVEGSVPCMVLAGNSSNYSCRLGGKGSSYPIAGAEIMALIGPEHESVKSTLGLLLEAYMR